MISCQVSHKHCSNLADWVFQVPCRVPDIIFAFKESLLQLWQIKTDSEEPIITEGGLQPKRTDCPLCISIVLKMYMKEQGAHLEQSILGSQVIQSPVEPIQQVHDLRAADKNCHQEIQPACACTGLLHVLSCQ